MDNKETQETSSNKIEYILPTPGQKKYFYGTDIEKIYNTLGDANIFSVNAKDLSAEMEKIDADIKYMQNNISWWIGDSSSNESKSMRTVLKGLEISLGNVQNAIAPACDKIALFKEKMAEMKVKEEELRKAESDLGAIRNRINNIEAEKAGIASYVSNGNTNYDNETDVDALASMQKQKEEDVTRLTGELDALLTECIELYDEIKAFEEELKAFEFVIGPDYMGILDDKDRLKSLSNLAKYMLIVGDCGSNQGAAMYLFQFIPAVVGDDFYDIIDENGLLPDEYGIIGKKYNDMVRVYNSYGITDVEEMIRLSTDLANVGCGYAASANILFDTYKDQPILFESSFGFPMYYTDEDNNVIYNYEAMLVKEFMTMYETHNGGRDLVDTSEMSLDPEGLKEFVIGMRYGNDPVFANAFENGEIDIDFSTCGLEPNVSSETEFFDNFNGWHIDSDYYPYEKRDELLTNEGAVELYNEYMKTHDYAVIALYDYDLEPIDDYLGLGPVHVDNGGHYMQIIGVSENGNFIVSSWGRKYELTNYKWVEERTAMGTDGNPILDDDGNELKYNVVGKLFFV